MNIDDIRVHIREAEGDDMANHHAMLDAAIKRGDGLLNWGKRMGRLVSQFQSLYAHALVEMERFREQAKATDRLRREHMNVCPSNYNNRKVIAILDALIRQAEYDGQDWNPGVLQEARMAVKLMHPENHDDGLD